MVPISCPEASVRNYNYSLLNNLEERSSRLLRGGSLKSRITQHYTAGAEHPAHRPRIILKRTFKKDRFYYQINYLLL